MAASTRDPARVPRVDDIVTDVRGKDDNKDRIPRVEDITHDIRGKGRPDERLYKRCSDLFREIWKIGNPISILRWEWRSLVAEFIGTAILVYFGTASAVAATTLTGFEVASIIVIALGFGIGGVVAVYATAETSGGHLNPAISFGMLVAMKMSLVKFLLYVGAQLGGAILASALVKGTFPQEMAGAARYGATSLSQGMVWRTNAANGISDIGVGQGVLFEIVFTFTLVFTVFATVRIPRETSHQGKLAPLAIGYAILIGHIVGSRFTGPSMNPARSFGPACISGYWDDHWVYWVGPGAGAFFAAIIYKYLIIHPVLDHKWPEYPKEVEMDVRRVERPPEYERKEPVKEVPVRESRDRRDDRRDQ